MGGGQIQLVSYGDQDLNITANPQITFFKTVYRRHTNFAIEALLQPLNSNKFDFGNTYSAVISRNGDLIQQIYLELTLPALTGSESNITAFWTYGIGNALLKTVEIDIGGQVIDRHYSEWLNIWTELTTQPGKRRCYDDMVGNSTCGVGQVGWCANRSYNLYIPLQFWFNRNPGLALPLIALQYHEIKINFELRALNELYLNLNNTANTDALTTALNTLTTAKGQGVGIKMYVNFIYLDVDERRRFSQQPHEYLIEQVQFLGDQYVAGGSNPSNSINYKLNFSHPVKELIWVHITAAHATQNTAYSTGDLPSLGNSWFNFGNTLLNNGSNSNDDTFNTARILFNSIDRFSEQCADYFRNYQNYLHHTNIPRTGQYDNRTLTMDKFYAQYIYTYSFAIHPEEHQPSGTCNFSKLDNASLLLTYSSTQSINDRFLKVYAVNYNVLRIISGMCGLAFST